jgi:aspartyl-tRNA(Asn)/glutamyl-tRNA(Gln) amidotransferase subunit B
MMRSKEDAHDYRYFPDPDLPPLVISEEWIDRVRAALPELPVAMQARFMDSSAQYGLSEYDARMLTSSKDLAAYFEASVAAGADAKLAANWIMGDISATLNREEKTIADSPVSSEALAGLIKRITDNTINNKTAKDVLKKMWESGDAADVIIERDGLKQESDTGAIEAIVDAVLAANPKAIEEYRSGKEKALNALVGQVMKGSGGKANPGMALELLKKKVV